MAPPPSDDRSFEETTISNAADFFSIAGGTGTTRRDSAGGADGDGVGMPNLLPRYQLGGRLGEGGMGVVFKACQVGSGRTVAVKVLKGECAAAAQFKDRLKNEANLVARLDHPGIVTLLECDVSTEPCYLVMAFVEGETLASFLGGEKPTRDRVIDLVLQVAEALRYAHDEGIIHRDINLSNIMIRERSSQAVVVDFGLAKSLDGLPSAWTLAGHMGGTPHFAAPEQNPWTMGPTGPYTDVFALGVTLYYLLIGRAPEWHEPRTEPSLMAIPYEPRLQTVIHRATQPRARDRYQTMAELIADLEKCRRWPHLPKVVAVGLEHGSEQWRSLAKRCRGLPAAYYVAAVTLFGVFLLIALRGNHYAGQPTEASKNRPFVNSMGMEFVPMPGSTVLISRRRVSRSVYFAFAGNETDLGFGWEKSSLWPGQETLPSDPVACVSWNDAEKFCHWLNEKEKRSYRLPTVAEWQNAAGPAGATSWPRLLMEAGVRDNSAVWSYVRGKTLPLETDRSSVPESRLPRRDRPWESWRMPNLLGVAEISLMGWEWCEDAEDVDGQSLRAARSGLCLQDGRAVFRSQAQPPDCTAIDPGVQTMPSGPPPNDHIEEVASSPQPFTFRCVLVPGSAVEK